MDKIKHFYKWVVSFFNHKFKKTLQNCPCYDDEGNFIGWFSRSVAVVLTCLWHDRDTDEWYALVSQRGEGTPDPEFRGAWNVTCGYLDFNETTEQAAVRELREETGVQLLPIFDKLNFWCIKSDPNGDKRQNVTVRYITLLQERKEYYEQQFSTMDSEENEVGEIRFINLKDFENYRWAFGHDSIIRDACEYAKKNTLDEHQCANSSENA